jgi:hypothetical protein
MLIAYLLYLVDRINRLMASQPSAPGLDADHNQLPLPPLLIHELRQALRTIRYGAIELVIHDGRVVQLELREKVRFEPDPSERRK